VEEEEGEPQEGVAVDGEEAGPSAGKGKPAGARKRKAEKEAIVEGRSFRSKSPCMSYPPPLPPSCSLLISVGL